MKNLSIIIPVYNVEKYIERCINSILSQNYTNFELILVDDGSTDSSGTILDKYAKLDERIKVFHQINQGQSAARNKGLDVAQGIYLTFIDADDYLIDPNIYVKCIKLLEEDEQIDIVQFSYARVDTKDQLLGVNKCSSLLYKNVQDFFCNIENISLDSISSIKDLVWNKVYRSNVIGNIRFMPNVDFEDAIFIVDLFGKLHGLKIISDVGYAYVSNPDSIMNKEIDINKASDAIRSNLHILRKANEFESLRDNTLINIFLHKIIHELICLKIKYDFDFDEDIYSEINYHAKSRRHCDTIRKNLILFGVNCFGARFVISKIAKLYRIVKGK